MSDELAILKQAVDGLLYPSETDAPFRVRELDVAAKAPGLEELAGLLGGAADSPVEELSIDEFFEALADAPQAEEYLKLRGLLNKQLSQIRVLRLGRVEIDVVIVGRTKGGKCVVLQTKSVET